ncbi:hypothetical protein JOM56_003103 [Amanita muscaria]
MTNLDRQTRKKGRHMEGSHESDGIGKQVVEAVVREGSGKNHIGTSLSRPDRAEHVSSGNGAGSTEKERGAHHADSTRTGLEPARFACTRQFGLPVSPHPLRIPPPPSSPMKRNALNSDISRILDPSYSPAGSNQPLSVYVDRHGNIHDPDYRQFPTIPNEDTSPRDPTDDDDDATPIDNDFYSHLTNAYNRAGNAYAKNKRNNQYSQYSHIYASYRSPYHYFSTPAPTSSSYSPPTSYDSDQTVFDDGEDSSIHEDSCHSQYNILKRKLGKRRGSGSSNGSGSQSPVSKSKQEKEKEKRMSSGSETPSPSAPAAVVADESFQFHYPHLHQPQPHHNQHHLHHHSHHHHHHHRASPPHRHLSPHNELDEQYLFSSSPVNGDYETGLGLEIEKPESPHRQQSQQQQPQEWTPTCTQSLRREWQALSLRFRFSVYRAKRRIKRRMESLI